jgi:hypothetical protein
MALLIIWDLSDFRPDMGKVESLHEAHHPLR